MVDRTSPLALLVAVLFVLGAALPISAQEVRFGNGATLHLTNGAVWDLKGGRMDLGEAGESARLEERSGGRVTAGRLTATRVLSDPASVNVAGLGAQITTSVDLGAVSVTRAHERPALPGSRDAIERYYDISPSEHNRRLSASLTLHYAEAELGELSEEDLEVFKSTDGDSDWRPMGADERDGETNTVTVDEIRSFSRWTLGVSETGPPIDIPGPDPGPPPGIPSSFALEENYPGPFNPSTTIRYQLPEATPVSLRVYDAMGRRVRTLVDERQSAGVKSVTFDAKGLPSGMYFYRLRAGSFEQVRTMVLAK